VDYSAGAMGSMVGEKGQQVSSPPFVADEAIDELGGLVNTSGHVQELDRNFGFWSICAISIVADDAWAAGAGSLVCSLLHAPQCGFLEGQRMLILVSLGRSLLSMMEELLVSSTNCESDPRDLLMPRTLTDLETN
jgi:hypothetical protein